MKKLIAALTVSLAMLGCATGGVSVESPIEGVAACYSAVETTALSAGDMKARGQLSPDQERKVKEAGAKALVACDAARVALGAGDFTKAEGQLAVVNALLLQIEAYMKGAQ